MRNRYPLAITVLVCAGLFFPACWGGPPSIAVEAKPLSHARAAASDAGQLELLRKIIEEIRAGYVEKPSEAKLVQGAINGILHELDPHSDYMDAESYREMQMETHGEFGGIGIRVDVDDGRVNVLAALENTPAARAGVKARDVITHIDGTPLAGLTLEQVAGRMRGALGTMVRLRIERDGESEPIAISLARETIKVRPVSFRREGDDVGYIRITRFSDQTTAGLKEAIAALSAAPGAPELRGYVLDLRNNPGGLIDQAVTVAGAFLGGGEIVSLRGHPPGNIEHLMAPAKPGDLTSGKPLIVLINGGSASSAEIVAGALRDHRRAILVGTRSFGKGSVQTIIPLGPGNGALRLTTARYFTPAGRSIQAQGIAPDVEVAQEVPSAFKALKVRSEATLPGHLGADGSEQAGSQSYVPFDPAQDKALQAALDLLRGARADRPKPTAADVTSN